MTIKDIAKESGYAIGTVSRVLNNNPSVSPAARAKILEVIKRYNYQPNSNAKHLKQQSSDGLALIVKGTQNMLFVDILEKMQAILEERGYVSTVYYIDEEANEVAQAELICAERKPYGIVFLGSNLEYFTPAAGGTACSMPAADQQRRNPEHPQPVQRQRGRCFGIVPDD